MEAYQLEMMPGMTLKLKGKITDDSDGFVINLGHSPKDIVLHFNPRFEEDVIVCNSQVCGKWQKEYRDDHLCFEPGDEIKLLVTFDEDEFQVKLPDGYQVTFPNRESCCHISYCCVKGGFSLTAFKLE
ncbi:galectin-2 [Sarcophilus harrisii]|nr:galectin-2 [Sarcophilus harrisii]XP_023360230.1 galectin-2 [Sarcophilus harrisii]